MVKKYKLEIFGLRHEVEMLSLDEIVPRMAGIPDGLSCTVTCNDGGEEVLIVGFCEDYSVASLLLDGIFYELQGSRGCGLRDVLIGGQWSSHEASLVLPREQGMEVLIQSENIRGLPARHNWIMR